MQIPCKAAVAALCLAGIFAGTARGAEPQMAAAPNPAELAAEAAIPLHAPDDSYWEISSGFDSSRGTYGLPERTTVSYVPVGLSFHSGAWTVSLDSGFIHVKGPLDYIDITELTGDEIVALDPNAGEASVNGLADITVGLKYALFEHLESGLFVDVGGRLKAPTASRGKGLGTGHAAGDLQLDVTQMLGPWALFVSGEYGIRDGRDADRNPWSASVGVSRSLTERLSAGTFYTWRQSVRNGGAAAHEAFVYASYRFSTHFSLTVYGVGGFSRGSPDREFGVRYAYRWN
ncbi:MAG: transporter [Rhodospirillaceae bacterium]|nr:transporter [Rhodospirillaceae bacterium]